MLTWRLNRGHVVHDFSHRAWSSCGDTPRRESRLMFNPETFARDRTATRGGRLFCKKTLTADKTMHSCKAEGFGNFSLAVSCCLSPLFFIKNWKSWILVNYKFISIITTERAHSQHWFIMRIQAAGMILCFLLASIVVFGKCIESSTISV